MNGEFNVLISCAGRRVALVEMFRQALKEQGIAGRVLATDMSRASSAFHAADRGIVVPPVSDPSFDQTMVALCREESIGLVIPTIDPELPIWSRLVDQLRSNGTTVAISSPETIAITADKRRTHAWLVEAGLPTIRQADPDIVLEDPAGWMFPVIVKPRDGSASLGVSIVEDHDELRRVAHGREVVVQSIAPGREHTIDALIDQEGRMVCAVPRQRIEVRSGESSKGVTVRHPALIELAERACDALPGAYGPITIQAFIDGPEINVIEINPRFGGGYPLAWAAGARYPDQIIQEVLGLERGVESNAWRDGLVMLRYDDAVFVDRSELGL